MIIIKNLILTEVERKLYKFGGDTGRKRPTNMRLDANYNTCNGYNKR